MGERWLTAKVADVDLECDGCGDTIPEGKQYLGGVQSCCSPMPHGMGCCRRLCRNCVWWAWSALV